MSEDMSSHMANLLDDGGLEEQIEDRLAADADFGPDEEGFLDPMATDAEPMDAGESVPDEGSDEAADSDTDEGGEPSLAELQAQIEAVRKESDGRLAALVENRERMRQANEGIESMRKLMFEWEQRARGPEQEKAKLAELAEKYGVDVVADPNNQFILDQLKAQEQRAEEFRQTEEGRKRQVAEQIRAQSAERIARQQAFEQVVAHEKVFIEKQPDYQDAYTHMRSSRQKFYENIYPGQDVSALLDREEEVVVAETLRAGGNVAERVYEMAKSLGYTPKQAKGAAGDSELSEEQRIRRERVKEFRRDNEFPDVNRLKAANAGSNLKGGSYNRGGNAQVLKGEQVFDQLPKARRMELFADPEKFKRFVLTGNLEI